MCIICFTRYSALEKHCDLGAHTKSLERITLQDQAKLTYAKYLLEGQTRERPNVQVPCREANDAESVNPSSMGWALKQS